MDADDVPHWEARESENGLSWSRQTEGCELFCSLALKHTPGVHDMYIHHCAILQLNPLIPKVDVFSRLRHAWVRARLSCPNLALKTTDDCTAFVYSPLLSSEDAVAWADETFNIHEVESIDPEGLLEARYLLSTTSVKTASGFSNSAHAYVDHAATQVGRIGIILRIDHAQFDALGVEILLGEFNAALIGYDTAVSAFDGREIQRLPPSTNHLVRADLVPSPADHDTILEKSLGGLDVQNIGFQNSRHLPPSHWAGTRHVNRSLGPELSAALVSKAKSQGHTVSQVQYAALTLAEVAHGEGRELTGQEVSATRMSVNLRPVLQESWNGQQCSRITMPAITPHSIILPIGQMIQTEDSRLLTKPSRIPGNISLFWRVVASVAGQFRQAASLSGQLACIQDKVVNRLLSASPPNHNSSFIMVCDGISDRYTAPRIETPAFRLDVPWKALSINYGGEPDTPLVNARCWSWKGCQYFGFDYNESALSESEALCIMLLWEEVLLKGLDLWAEQ